MYQFSAPMPYSKEDIDKLLDINNQVEKSRITSLYFALPWSCELFTGFELNRFNHEISNFEYWKELIKYSILKGFDFIYLLNSPSSINYSDFKVQLDKLDKLLFELNKIGVNKLRVSNPQLIDYLKQHCNEFILYSSVGCEYKTIKEYGVKVNSSKYNLS